MKLKLLQIREATGCEITTPEAILSLMSEEGKADRECFWVLHLNTRCKVIEKELVAMGTLDTAIVHPREVFRKAILNSAQTIVTVHNHPSGYATPSKEDREIWERLKKAGDIIGIEVLDNLIITNSGCYSSKRGS